MQAGILERPLARSARAGFPKGAEDRLTMLPQSVRQPLLEHLKRVQAIHQRDLEEGWGRVHMPDALRRSYPSAAAEWGWQYVFPAEHDLHPRVEPWRERGSEPGGWAVSGICVGVLCGTV